MEGWVFIVASVCMVGLVRVIFGGRGEGDGHDTVTRALARRARVPVRDVQNGVVRVTGLARVRGEPLYAPVTGRPCAAYQLVIEGWESSRLSGWAVLLELQNARPFSVMDESGEAAVDTNGATVLSLVPDRQGPSRKLDETDRAQLEVLHGLLAAQQVPGASRLDLPGAIRFREGVITEGARISVGARAVREGAPERILLRGTPEDPLLISDAPAAHGAPA